MSSTAANARGRAPQEATLLERARQTFSRLPWRTLEQTIASRIRSSLWFLPATFVVLGVLAAFGLYQLERATGEQLRAWLPATFFADGEGARSMLGAIATAMATIAGVAFSITTVVITLAASQYSPNVIRSFMRDRKNQSVLGAFVGIFAYCLVVLRVSESPTGETFSPALATAFALVLALVGIGVLVYFIHHVASSIEVTHIVATAFDDARRTLERVFPETSSTCAGDEDADDMAPAQRVDVASDRTGYVARVDLAGLAQLAEEWDTVIEMKCALGDFVVEGRPIAAVAGDAGHDASIVERFGIERQRTVDQDPSFGIRQIVDIALKALSPGINDVTTAVTCVDYLSALLLLIAGREEPRVRHRVRGRVRLMVQSTSFARVLHLAFRQIRQNAGTQVLVYERLVHALEALEGCCARERQRRSLATEARLLAVATTHSIPLAEDRDPILNRLRALGARLGEDATPRLAAGA